jgi:hypothetical protein
MRKRLRKKLEKSRVWGRLWDEDMNVIATAPGPYAKDLPRRKRKRMTWFRFQYQTILDKSRVYYLGVEQSGQAVAVGMVGDGNKGKGFGLVISRSK